MHEFFSRATVVIAPALVAALAAGCTAPSTATSVATQQPSPAVTSLITPAQPGATPTAPATFTPVPASATPGVNATAPIAATPTTPPPTATPTETPEPIPHISLAPHGINVADYGADKIGLVTELGFGWVQVFSPPDFPIGNFKIIYRVPLGSAISGQQADIDSWGEQLESLARERSGLINAYSIGNEVNLAREWGGNQPDPALYTRLLTVAYARIKAADPSALVISAGIAPTGGDGPGSMDDLAYARAMFDAGALSVMDAYGFHPYGFAYEPERDPADAQTKGLLFRRAEAHRKLMEEYGGADKQMWATEFGWLIDAKEEGVDCQFGALDWQRVPRKRQAMYTVRAFDYAAKNWPWMGPMFLWNYDFSRSPLYPDKCEQMKWFSLFDEQGAERPIVGVLRQAIR